MSLQRTDIGVRMIKPIAKWLASVSKMGPWQRLSIVTLVTTLLLAGLMTQVHQAKAAPLAQAPVNPPSAREGSTLFQENCAPCHGVAGLGDGPTSAQLSSPAAALADPDLARRVTPAEWFQVTKEGRMDRFMPPWKNRLSDEQIWDVVTFSLGLHVGQEELDRGEQVWGQQCAACHGDQGAGDGPQAVAANLQMPSFSDLSYASTASLLDWFSVTGAGQGAMPAFATELSEEDIWAAVTYARSFAFSPITPLAVPQGAGRLSGQVTNGTPGGDSVEGLTVTLRSFQHIDELRSQTAQAGPDGRFAFEALPTEPTYFYVLTTEYKGIPFATDLVTFDEGQTDQEVSLPVWESSNTPGTITASLAQWFVEYQDGALLVGELYRLNHDSDRIYLGDEQVAPGRSAVLRFTLPDGATSLLFENGEIGDRYFPFEGGMVDTQPLPPGQVQVVLRYLLPYGGTRAELSHSIPYATDQLSVLVAEGATVEGEGLQEVGPRLVGERQFLDFQASKLPAGQPVSLQFRGLERAGAASVTAGTAVLAFHPPLLFGAAAVAGTAILGLLMVPVIRGRRRAGVPRPRTASAGVEEEDLESQRLQVLRVIADLDDRYQAGELDEASYQALRASRKRMLVQITQQLQEGPDAAQGLQAEVKG